jgi:hypothetical protein
MPMASQCATSLAFNLGPFGHNVAQIDVKKVFTRLFRIIVATILRSGPIPQHIAFIMDGNRRYVPLT